MKQNDQTSSKIKCQFSQQLSIIDVSHFVLYLSEPTYYGDLFQFLVLCMWKFRAYTILFSCIHSDLLARHCVLAHGRGGQTFLPTQAQSSITHNFLCFGTSPFLSSSHTHTCTSLPDAYLTASNSFPSLMREETVRRLCLEGLLPCLDLCKDTAESDGLHPSSVAAPTKSPLTTFVIRLGGVCLAPSCGK